MARQAVEHVRKLKGGAQSHLMRCDDGHYYVVKFQNNPQGVRILANEMIASKLALALGLPTPHPEVVEVSQWLVEHTPELYIEWGKERIRCASGFQFGSRFPCDPLRTPVYDFLPDSLLETVANRGSFLGMLVFDKWTCNCDSRQTIFYRPSRSDSSPYVAMMIDQGFCFNANEWSFPDAPLRGVFSRLSVYAEVAGLESFEPYLSRLESLDDDLLEEAAASVPPEWYAGDTEELGGLLRALASRRRKVAALLMALRNLPKRPFPNWRDLDGTNEEL
ncbi:MAG: phosphatidylinositol kinase [Acidobacteria bacterium]|nr:phosphatidylinositol kinase [Acidobacteriota bacterium]